MDPDPNGISIWQLCNRYRYNLTLGPDPNWTKVQDPANPNVFGSTTLNSWDSAYDLFFGFLWQGGRVVGKVYGFQKDQRLRT